MPITIRISRERLSDNSDVWNVHLGEITLHAITEAAAYDLAHCVKSCIQNYTVDTAVIYGDW